jgi:hypothetical protein
MIKRLLVRVLVALADHCAEHCCYMGPFPYFIVPPVPDSVIEPDLVRLTRAERKAFAQLERNWSS